MKHICSVVSLLIFIKLSFGKCIAFYYWDNPPVELLYAFDIAVLDPDNTDKEFLNGIETYNKKAKVLAYLSLGEIEKYRKDFSLVKESWLLGKNKLWDSWIADIRQDGYRQFLINRVQNIYQKNFDGIFLDTIDSYKLIFEDKQKQKEYEKAIVSFIKELKSLFPDKLIAINRGFEIFEEVKDYIDIFVIENLFTRYEHSKGVFREISPKEQSYLIENLKEISKYKDVVVIEYVNPSDKEQAFSLIEKIKSLGFIPYVSNLKLNIIGYSECTPEPRKALLLYNSDIQLTGKKDPSYSNVHRLSQLFLEYYGLVPIVRDINEGLPKDYIADRYKVIVVWIDEAPDPDYFFHWIKEKIETGIKVIFIDSFGFPLSKEYLQELGITFGKTKGIHWELDKTKSQNWFEIPPPPYKKDFYLYPEDSYTKPIFVFKNELDQYHVPIAITKWGAYALEGYFVRAIVEDFFVVNPFEFIKNAIGDTLEVIPDTTTESGNRILFVHVDGDGFNQKTKVKPKKYKYASQVIKKEIIQKFQIPHSISIIEGEIAPWGAYPNQAHKELENIARKILLSPNVEPASHSFSHPFDWYGLYYSNYTNEGYNLKIENYKFDLYREIKGSIDYIQNRLLSNKKPVNLFFWTGDCIPPIEALKLVYQLNIYNINGGDTYITKDKPLLSLISPIGINKGKYFQVYAQIQNDNIYTNSFAVPYGYKKVIETFILTDQDYRLKPIDIYYHFFSGSLPASLKALKEVYSWSLAQEIIPMYTSDFIKIALDSRTTTLKKEKNSFIIKNNGSLKTFRVEKKVDIDLIKSKSVAGYRHIKGRTYISTDSTGEYIIVITKTQPSYPFRLLSSNTRVQRVNIQRDSFEISLSGYQSIILDAYIRPNCTLDFEPRDVQITKFKDFTKIKTTHKRLKIHGTCRE
ncbi:MAG: polysaccharide deacetylase [Aquificae bacterium]|nr:polysaccharide deacetylase [Aquificota bacterium]